MTISILAALGTLGLLTVIPGPDMAIVTRAALADGRRAAGETAAGVVSGLLVWGLLAVGGLAAVLAASADLYAGLRLAGAAYLICLGLRTLWRSRGRADGADRAGRAEGAGQVDGSRLAEAAARVGGAGRAGAADRRRSGRHRAWTTGFATNLMNPKIGVFYTSALPALVPAGAPVAATQAGLVVAHAVLSVVWLNGWARVVTGSRSVLRRPGALRAGERVGGAALVCFGVEIVGRTA